MSDDGFMEKINKQQKATENQRCGSSFTSSEQGGSIAIFKKWISRGRHC